jgi:hypothetical protein
VLGHAEGYRNVVEVIADLRIENYAVAVFAGAAAGCAVATIAVSRSGR